MSYAAETKVPVGQSKTEIERLLRHGWPTSWSPVAAPLATRSFGSLESIYRGGPSIPLLGSGQ